ncbi:MAG: hypothetical protein WC876_01850 [Candidatus Thermoplasmatota archaeon]|jgi:hypothetical protein
MSLAMLTKRQRLEKELSRTKMLLDVMGRMHALLLKHLETTGKMTVEEQAAWEESEMVPALAAMGVTLKPAGRPKSNLVGLDGQPIAGP